MNNVIKDREIRVGVLGAFRGKAFAVTAKASGMKLVAICDNFKHRLDEVCGELDVPGYEDFDEFIKQDFDAVVIAAPFHTHAHFAKLALKAGKHVFSETSCNVTLAEGVELYRLAQETGLCYMLAENYCYTRFNQEFKRLYDADEIGEVRYAEGEYNHPLPLSESLWYAPGLRHWRNWMPGCYYITHALAPLMYITNTLPVEVSCSLIPVAANVPPESNHHRPGFVMLVRMDNGAIFRIYSGVSGHSCWYSLHGTHGAMEVGRGAGYFGKETVRVWHEPWELRDGQVAEKEYFPEWSELGKLAESTGHGGGDFFVEHTFAEAIRTGKQPYLDAFHGITMSNVGIIAWKSAHKHGAFLPVPDLRDPAAQEEMLKDRMSPMPDTIGAKMMPRKLTCPRKFTPAVRKAAKKAWKRQGYTDEEIKGLLNQDVPYPVKTRKEL